MAILLMDICSTLSHWGPRKMAAVNASLPRGRGNPVQLKTFATHRPVAVVDGGLLTSYS